MKSFYGTGNWQKIMNHICTISCSANRIFRNICFHTADFQIIAGIEHSAICIASAILQIILGFFCCCAEHNRTISPVLCQQCFGYFRSEVAKVHNKCIALMCVYICKSLYHIGLTFDNGNRALIYIFFVILCCISSNQSFSSLLRKSCRKTITADRNNTDLCLWNVIHGRTLLNKNVFKVDITKLLLSILNYKRILCKALYRYCFFYDTYCHFQNNPKKNPLKVTPAYLLLLSVLLFLFHRYGF